MKKEELVSKMTKPILMPLGLLQVIFTLAVLSSPLIWLWISWSLAWKIALSGVILNIVNGLIYNYILTVAKKEVDKIFNNDGANY